MWVLWILLYNFISNGDGVWNVRCEFETAVNYQMTTWDENVEITVWRYFGTTDKNSKCENFSSKHIYNTIYGI